MDSDRGWWGEDGAEGCRDGGFAGGGGAGEGEEDGLRVFLVRGEGGVGGGGGGGRRV